MTAHIHTKEKNITDLPNEVLLNIFENISVKDAFNCRLVCKRWRDNIDYVESVWKKLCEVKFINSSEDLKKSKLTWRQLYKSLNLWPNIKNATLTVNKLLGADRHYVLKCNGLLSLSNSKNSNLSNREINLYDTVKYYDLLTLKESHSEVFSINFYFFDEGDDFYVLFQPVEGRSLHVNLYVIPKVNRKPILIGMLRNNGEEVTTLNDRVYLRNCDRQILLVKVKNGVVIIEKIQEMFYEEVLCFSCFQNELYILTQSLHLYMLIDGVFEMIEDLEVCELSDTIQSMLRHGYQWNKMPMIEWLNRYYEDDCPLLQYRYCITGNMVIMGAKGRMLKFYYNPYDNNKTLRLFSTDIKLVQSPDLVVSLEKYHEFDCKLPFNYTHISWLDSVCKENGHRLFVMASNVLFILDFDFDSDGATLKSSLEDQSETKDETGPSLAKYRKEEISQH